MSMRINTNTDAIAAMRHLQLTGNMLTTATERLSSGLRINHAADEDRKSTRLNSSHIQKSRMPSSA